jgi:penicillin-binding protein 1A
VGLQQAAEDAVRHGLQGVDARYKVATPLKHYDDPATLQAGVAKLIAQQGDRPAAGRVLLGIVQDFDTTAKAYKVSLGSVDGALAAGDLERYRAPADAKKGETQGAAVTLRSGDLIRVSLRENTPKGWTLSPEFGPQAALVALDPKTRLVRALVGGDDFDLHPYDRTRALRQPGSTFKTFTYGAAIEAGLVTADSERVDAAVAYPVGGKTWTPRNFSGGYDGKSHTLRDALAQSINSIAVAVAQQVGPAQVAKFAERMGIHSPLTVGLPLALGASSVTLLELTNAYATIAADGRLAEPILITRIVDRTGKDLYLAPQVPGQVVASEGVTRQLTDMLGEVVRRGSGKEAQNAGRPVVGKTGTSNASRDTWFVGFSADLCAGVWVGYDDRKEMPKATGGMLAVPIWTQFFKQGLAAVPVRPLPRLPHVLAGAVANLPGPAIDAEAGAADLDDSELAPENVTAPPAELPKRHMDAPIDDDAVQ